MNDNIIKLNNSFKPRNSSGKASYRHDREAEIIDQLRFVMKHSPMAQSLLDFADEHKIEIHVLKNKAGFGFVPESSHVYIAASPDTKTGSSEMIIHLVAALREAQQEFEPQHKRPNVSMGEEAFVERFANKKSDVRWHQCAVVDQLATNLNFTEIIDSFKEMGYGSILEGYRKDQLENS